MLADVPSHHPEGSHDGVSDLKQSFTRATSVWQNVSQENTQVKQEMMCQRQDS